VLQLQGLFFVDKLLSVLMLLCRNNAVFNGFGRFQVRCKQEKSAHLSVVTTISLQTQVPECNVLFTEKFRKLFAVQFEYNDDFFGPEIVKSIFRYYIDPQHVTGQKTQPTVSKY